MTPTPTLDPQRTDQIRSFLTVEAAADAAHRRPILTPTRRRVLVGATAVLVLGGAFVAAEAVGGPAPAAIAVEVDGGWTTVRVVDIDADPDAVVDQLRAAGFAAERQPLQVVRTEDGKMTVSQMADPDRDHSDVGVVAFTHGEEGGAHGLVGLSASLPRDLAPSPPPPAGAPGDGGPVIEDELEGAGLRFEPDGGISLRAGTDVTIIVYTER